MPRWITYEYKCENCEEKIDLNVDFEERDKMQCPQCGEILIRLLSAPNFFRKSGTRNAKEKAIKRDIIESTYIEEELARGKVKDKEGIAKATKEYNKLIYEK